MMHCVGTASESDAPIMGDLPNQTVPLAPVPLARQQGGVAALPSSDSGAACARWAGARAGTGFTSHTGPAT